MKKGENPKVVLTTIHSAKGLEFENVYYFHSHDWYKNYDLEQTEEDRRLFYVGISRAKTNLYVFDHTEVKRSFENILRDFDKEEMAKAPESIDIYANLAANEGLKVNPSDGKEKANPDRYKDLVPEVDTDEPGQPDAAEKPAKKSNVIMVDFSKGGRR